MRLNHSFGMDLMDTSIYRHSVLKLAAPRSSTSNLFSDMLLMDHQRFNSALYLRSRKMSMWEVMYARVLGEDWAIVFESSCRAGDALERGPWAPDSFSFLCCTRT